MKNTATIYYDYREPPRLAQKLKYYIDKEEVDVGLKKAELKTYDVIFVLDGKVRIGAELKRIASDDFVDSLRGGRLKEQVWRIKDMNNLSFLFAIGDTNMLSVSDRKALLTIKAELDLIGIKADTVKSDGVFAFQFIRMCQYYLGDKTDIKGGRLIRFKAYCNVVKSDDSILTRMLKQFDNFGDADSEKLGAKYENFFDMFITDIDPRKLIIPSIPLILSNELRLMKGKTRQKKPLKKVKELIDWFFRKRGG